MTFNSSRCPLAFDRFKRSLRAALCQGARTPSQAIRVAYVNFTKLQPQLVRILAFKADRPSLVTKRHLLIYRSPLSRRAISINIYMIYIYMANA